MSNYLEQEDELQDPEIMDDTAEWMSFKNNTRCYHKKWGKMAQNILEVMFHAHICPAFTFSTISNKNAIKFETALAFQLVKLAVTKAHETVDDEELSAKIQNWWDHKSDYIHRYLRRHREELRGFGGSKAPFKLQYDLWFIEQRRILGFEEDEYETEGEVESSEDSEVEEEGDAELRNEENDELKDFPNHNHNLGREGEISSGEEKESSSEDEAM